MRWCADDGGWSRGEGAKSAHPLTGAWAWASGVWRAARCHQLLVSLVPMVGENSEQKSKPTQASVRDLRGLGLSPDVVRP